MSVLDFARDIASNTKKALGLRQSAGLPNRLDALVTHLQSVQQARQAREAFLLGSGSSLLELDESHFASIESGISIGLNLWVLHDFVPDVYYFEGTGDQTAQELCRSRIRRCAH